jgi:hypothetical protein
VAAKAEQVLDALKALLEMVPDAIVQRNRVRPERSWLTAVSVDYETDAPVS